MANEFSPSKNRQKLVTQGFLVPFILITSLSFFGYRSWHAGYSEQAFPEYAEYVKSQSGMIQFSVYTAYFGMALPADIL